MKKQAYVVAAVVALLLLASTATAQTIYPNRGGTGNTTTPALGQLLVGQSNGTYAPQATSSLGLPVGTVTSVGLSAPVGFVVSGTPVTGSGTLGLAFDTGFVLPLTASTTEWAKAYASSSILSALSPLLYDAHAGAFSISSNPSFATIAATSTTGTSTFAGAVGIGTTTPLGLLTVASGDDDFRITKSANNIFNMILFEDGTQSLSYRLDGAGSGGNNKHVFRYDTTDLMTIMASGNIGIGTSTPAQLLHVASGQIRLTNSGTSFVWERPTGEDLTLWGTSNNHPLTRIYRSDGVTILSELDGNNRHQTYLDGMKVGIGTTTPGAILAVMATAGGSTPLFNVGSSTAGLATSTALYVDATGRVGIAVSDPAYPFETSRSTVGPEANFGRAGSAGTDYIYVNERASFGHVGSNAFNNSAGAAIGASSGRSVHFFPGDLTFAATPSVSMLSTGNVGIGTTTPISLLTVGSGSAGLDSVAAANSLAVTASGAIGLAVESRISSGPTSGVYGGFYSNDGAVMASGDRLGGILIGGSSDPTTLRSTVAISGYAEEAWVNGSGYGSALIFETNANGSTTRTEKMRLSANGNLGIGTTTPGAKVTVADGDIYIASSTRGIILRSPDGTCARGVIDNADALTFASVTCP